MHTAAIVELGVVQTCANIVESDLGNIEEKLTLAIGDVATAKNEARQVCCTITTP